jgi:PAS domain S-box-containing protein
VLNKIPKEPGNKRTATSMSSVAATAGDLHHLAFDNSFLANIISIVSTGKIIMANMAACKLLGYSNKELLTKNRETIFDIKDSSFKKMLRKRTIEGKSEASVTCIKKSGRLVPCLISSAVFTDTDGLKKSISTISDMSQSIHDQKNIDSEKDKIVADNIVLAKSKQKKIDVRKEKIVADNIELAKEKQRAVDVKKDKIIEEYQNRFKLAFNSSSEVLYDSDLVTNVIKLSDGYENEFGHSVTGNEVKAKNWFGHIHPDDQETIKENYDNMLASSDIEWRCAYRFLKADGSVANVLNYAIILRNENGKAYRMIGSVHDISKQKVLEQRLENEIKFKEREIADAMKDAKEAERSDIGKELHDNVNQLLGASRLYLDMAKRGGINTPMYLSRSSEYTLSAIEEIRKLTQGLTTDIIKNLGLREAIKNIAADTMETSSVKISCVFKRFTEEVVTDKFKLNALRIVQEQLNNILKHANATSVAINLLQDKKSIVLTISDDGIGFDTTKKRKGSGLGNIRSRVASYNGTVDFVSQVGKGCVLSVMFPLSNVLSL